MAARARPGDAIVDFVARTCGDDGSPAVPVEERVAVFDNDGTLWCEQPMPIQLDFILRRFAEMVAADPARERQPWKAAASRTTPGSARLMPEHYAGDDTERARARGRDPRRARGDQRRGLRGPGRRVPARHAQHPTLGRAYLQCAYAPMVELLGYLEAHGFTNYIASGGGRDFMRPISLDMYGIPRERVIGSSSTFTYTSDEPAARSPTSPQADYLDDGPEKPVRIWNRIGRRPLLAGGNSNGDVPMLEFTHHAAGPRCACSCCTTTPSASSPTPPAPSGRSNGRPRDGWTVVSMARTTGRTVF